MDTSDNPAEPGEADGNMNRYASSSRMNDDQDTDQVAGYAGTSGVGPMDPSGGEEEGEEIIECPVPGCGARYRIGAMSNLRSKVCNAHQKMERFMVDGIEHRYCHQCYKIHPLSEFSGNKRSCTLRLERHNLRRRLNRLYRKSWSKESDGASESNAPDHKAAVDLAMQIMTSAQDGAVEQVGPSSKRAAAGKALQAAISATQASAAPSGRSDGTFAAGAQGLAAGVINPDMKLTDGSSGAMGLHNAMQGSIGRRGTSEDQASGIPYNMLLAGRRTAGYHQTSGGVPGNASNANDFESYLSEYDRYCAQSDRRAAAARIPQPHDVVSDQAAASGQVLKQQRQQQQQHPPRSGMDGLMRRPAQAGLPAAAEASGSSQKRGRHGGPGDPRYAWDPYSPAPGGGLAFPGDVAAGGRPLPVPSGNRRVAGEGSGSAERQLVSGPTGSQYLSAQGQAIRPPRTPANRPVYSVAMKMFGDVNLSTLPPGLKEQVQSWLDTTPVSVDEYLREGCVHMILDFELHNDEDYMHAIRRTPAGFASSVMSAMAEWPWCHSPTTLWLPDRILHAEDGEIVADVPLHESNCLDLKVAEVVVVKSPGGLENRRILKLHSCDLEVPGLKVLLRTPSNGAWQQLNAYQESEVEAPPTSSSLSSDATESPPGGSGSGASQDTDFEECGPVKVLPFDIPDFLEQGLAYVEILVDGGIGLHRQSRPMALYLPSLTSLLTLDIASCAYWIVYAIRN